MPGGAPRTTSLSPPEMELLGQEMVAWVKQNEDTILHLSEWYTIEKMFTYNQWKVFIKCKEFFPYYELALKIVGKKYLNKDSQVNPSISQRWQRVYFKDLRDSEDEDAALELQRKKELLEHDNKLKSQSSQQVADDIIAQFDATMNMLSKIQRQGQSSSLSIADNNNNIDTKSE